MDQTEEIEKRKQAIFEKLKPIIVDRLAVEEDEVTMDKTLRDLSADSLDSVELIMEVEKQYNIAIPDEDTEKLTNIQSIVDYIFNNTPAPAPAAQ